MNENSVSGVPMSPSQGNQKVAFEFEKGSATGAAYKVNNIFRLGEGAEGSTCLVQYNDGQGVEHARICYTIHGKQGGIMVFMQRQTPDPTKPLVAPPEDWFRDAFVEKYMQLRGGRESL